jgi:precorrin-6B methylase 1
MKAEPNPSSASAAASDAKAPIDALVAAKACCNRRHIGSVRTQQPQSHRSCRTADPAAKTTSDIAKTAKGEGKLPPFCPSV